MPCLLVWAIGEHELKLRGYMYIPLFVPCKEIRNPGDVCLWHPESVIFFL